MLADVIHPVLENTRAALRAFAQRLLAGKVHFRGRAPGKFVAVAEVELGLEFRAEFDDGGKRKALRAAETLQRPDDALGDEFLDFVSLKLAAGDNFPKGKVAALALEFFVVFLDDAAALRTRSLEGAEIAGHGVAFITFGLLDDVARHGGDLLHELVALHLAALDLAQFEFPVAGQFGRAEFRYAQAAQQGDEREGLGG